MAAPWVVPASARFEDQSQQRERGTAPLHDESQLETEAQQIHARLVARGRLYTRLTNAGWLPSLQGSGGLWEHLSLLARLRTALRRDLEREREVVRLKVEAERLASERTERKLLPGDDPAFREQERASAFLRAFGGVASPTQHTTIYAALGPADSKQRDTGLPALKGRLPFPVTGRVEVTVTASPGGAGDGLLARAPAGAMARAVYPGRVAFADTYGEYGRSVILEHGSGYYTLSAGLGAIQVHVGDELESGAILGPCGRDESRESATGQYSAVSMYFELRRGAQVVEPGPWFGL